METSRQGSGYVGVTSHPAATLSQRCLSHGADIAPLTVLCLQCPPRLCAEPCASGRSPVIILGQISNLCDLSLLSVTCNGSHVVLVGALRYILPHVRCRAPVCSRKYSLLHLCTFASRVDLARDTCTTSVHFDLHHVSTLAAEHNISWHTREPMSIL